MSWQCQRCGKHFRDDVYFTYFNNDKRKKYCEVCAEVKNEQFVEAEKQRQEAQWNEFANYARQRKDEIRERERLELNYIESIRDEYEKAEKIIGENRKKYVETINPILEKLKSGEVKGFIDVDARRKWFEENLKEKCPNCNAVLEFDKFLWYSKESKLKTIDDFLAKDYTETILKNLDTYAVSECGYDKIGWFTKFLEEFNELTVKQKDKRMEQKKNASEIADETLKEWETHADILKKIVEGKVDAFELFKNYLSIVQKKRKVTERPIYSLDSEAFNKLTIQSFYDTYPFVVIPKKNTENIAVAKSYNYCCKECYKKYLEDHTEAECKKNFEEIKKQVDEKKEELKKAYIKKQKKILYCVLGVVAFGLISFICMIIGAFHKQTNKKQFQDWQVMERTLDNGHRVIDDYYEQFESVLGKDCFYECEGSSYWALIPDDKKDAIDYLLKKFEEDGKNSKYNIQVMPAGHAFFEDLAAASNFYNLKVNGTTRLLYARNWKILIVDITTNEKGKVINKNVVLHNNYKGDEYTKKIKNIGEYTYNYNLSDLYSKK